jgi:hypothetical protein
MLKLIGMRRMGGINLNFGHNLRMKIEKFRNEIIEDFGRI